MSSASYVGIDTTNQGTWIGVYGSLGRYKLEQSPPVLDSSLPSGMTISNDGGGYCWHPSVPDLFAIQRAASPTDRDEIGWYGGSSTLTFTITPSDGTTRRMSCYFLDGGGVSSRDETIRIKDHGTSSTLDTRSIVHGTDFSNGLYLIWDVSGAVDIEITLDAGPNPVMTAIFFDTPPSGGVTIDPGEGTETFTGASPTLKYSIKPATASETISAASPTLKYAVKPATTSETISAASPTLKYAVKPATATETLTGATPDISVTGGLHPNTASLALTGASPKLKYAVKPATATETLTGASPGLINARTITPAEASLSLTGASPFLGLSFRIPTATEVLSGASVHFAMAYAPATRTETLTGATLVLHIGPTIQPLVVADSMTAIILEDDSDPFGIDPFYTQYLL